jgi:class 3 adenylate cyclase
LAVNIAKRVCDLARPGEVLVTRTVADQVVGSGIAFGDRGECDLKGVPGRWRLVRVEHLGHKPNGAP